MLSDAGSIPAASTIRAKPEWLESPLVGTLLRRSANLRLA